MLCLLCLKCRGDPRGRPLPASGLAGRPSWSSSQGRPILLNFATISRAPAQTMYSVWKGYPYANGKILVFPIVRLGSSKTRSDLQVAQAATPYRNRHTGRLARYLAGQKPRRYVFAEVTIPSSYSTHGGRARLSDRSLGRWNLQ